MLGADDEEVEVLPHVKATTDFEVYERVTLPDGIHVLPWDENVKKTHTFKLKVAYIENLLLLLLLFYESRFD